MKNQYFGDINDFRKYGLLRALSEDGKLKIGVCWMLTPDDGRTDGSLTRYLDEPSKWRGYDPVLFDSLKQSMRVDTGRNVRQAESAHLLPSARFYTKLFADNPNERQQSFNEVLRQFRSLDLTFFDPDNGLEIQSVRYGRKYSSKYLYWHEVSSAFGLGCSLLIYQHFPREKHREFTARKATEIQSRIGAVELYSFSTSQVVFFLIVQARHARYFRRQAKRVAEIWGNQFHIQPYAV